MMRALLLLAVLLLQSTSLLAAELSLLAGYRSGGPSVEVQILDCFRAPCPQPRSEARDGEAFGLILDLEFRDRLQIEILLSHQSGKFETEAFDFLDIDLPIYQPVPQRFDITYLHFGLLRQWEKTKVSPFAAVGFGLAQLEADRPFFFDPFEADRLSASLAGGVKVHLSRWFGVRVEGRGYWADMPAATGEDLFQLELSSGLIFRL